MREFYIFILLVLWYIFTILLAISIFGLYVLIEDEWYEFREDLTDKL